MPLCRITRRAARGQRDTILAGHHLRLPCDTFGSAPDLLSASVERPPISCGLRGKGFPIALVMPSLDSGDLSSRGPHSYSYLLRHMTDMYWEF